MVTPVATKHPELSRRLSSFIRDMESRHAVSNARLRVRRMLLDMADTAANTKSSKREKGNATGTNVPAPFDESELIIKTMIGDAADAVQNYASRIASNPPICEVDPIAKRTPSHSLQKNAGEQERLLNSMWANVGGRKAQRRSAYSQTWGRVGYYLTLPRDLGFGLPDRKFYDDLTDERLEDLARKGTVVPIDSDQGIRFAESADTWFEARRNASMDNAVAGKSLFTLEEYPPDMVMVEMDRGGDDIARGIIIEEVSAADYQPGQPKAAEVAKAMGVDEGDVGKFGVWTYGGSVVTGISQGSEPGNSAASQKFRLITYVDREILAYIIAPHRGADGVVVHMEEHGGNRCPLIAIPAMVSDSRRDGMLFTSPMESVFTLTPIINQIETLLSNIAVYNSLPRWVVEDAKGNLIRDPDTNQPKMIGSDPTVGLDPAKAEVVGGTVKQLEIKMSSIIDLLRFYTSQLDAAKPAKVTEGQGGSGGPAWTARQQLEQASALLGEPVENHAEGVQKVEALWVHWMRTLDVPVYEIGVPNKRQTKKNRRGMIEFHPADFIDTFIIRQEKRDSSERTILSQAGAEKLLGGLIDDYEFFTDYDLKDDPQEAVIRRYVQFVKNFVLLGDTTQLQPGSLLWRVAQSVQGQVALELLDVSPNFAIGMAEQLAATAAAPNAAAGPTGGSHEAGAGPPRPAEEMGLRQAGLGASTSLAGSPEGRADLVRPTG